MKAIRLSTSIFFAVTLLLLVVSPVVAADATIVVENKPENDLLVLQVGETYTFDVRVTSAEPFVVALALGDQFYPGRGIFFNGNDRANHASEAMLHLTLTGKEATANLAAVTDWPTTEDWPAGVAPASIIVGIRYAGGQLISQRYNFAVSVP